MKKKPLTLIIFDKINKDFSEHSVLNCISLPASCMMHIKVNTVAVQLQFIGVIIEIHFFFTWGVRLNHQNDRPKRFTG